MNENKAVEEAHLEHVGVEAVGDASVANVQMTQTLVAYHFLDVENEQERVGRYGKYS